MRTRLAARGLALCVAIASGKGGAACSRPIQAAYTAPEVAAAFNAHPESHLPALQDELQLESGCRLLFGQFPTARVWHDFLAGHLDLVIGAQQTQERDGAGTFFEVLHSPWLLLTQRPPGTLPDRLEDISHVPGLMVGGLRGAEYPPDLSRLTETLRRHHQLDESTDMTMMVRKLGGGRDAVILLNMISYQLLKDRLDPLHVQTLPQPQFTPGADGIYISRSSLNPRDEKTLTNAVQSVLAQNLPQHLLERQIADLQAQQSK